jgi:hypothetical protein
MATVGVGELREASTTAPGPFFTAERVARWMTAFLWLGLAARAVRYLLRFPLWEDECFLCVNFIDRSFADLLTPLTYHQVAPPLFLWAERSAVLAFGYSEWSLRLVPFAASVASLFLFRHLASRLLSGPALLLAFGVFAVSYPGIRYAAEAKQYATDLFAALALLSLAAEWRRSRRAGWLWLLTAVAPVLLWLSYPAAFVVGGVSLAVGVTLLSETRDKRRQSREAPSEPRPSGSGSAPPVSSGEPLQSGRSAFSRPSSLIPRPSSLLSRLSPWLAFNLTVLIGFGSLFFVIRRQSGAELGFMTDYWRTAFPPLSEPGRLPVWLLEVHTSDLVAWPIGGGRGASLFTALLAAIGLQRLLRKRDPFWGLLLLAPAGLNLVAAALHRYPYGGHVKFSMYFGPAVCLLAGWGAAAWNDRTAKLRPQLARYGAAVTLAALMLVAGSSIARDVLRPYKTLSDDRARAFAKWFWFNAEAEGPVRLVEGHDGRTFSPDSHSELSWTAMFLCNRAIYSPAAGQEPPTTIPGAARPVRCLVYRDPRFDFDAAARDGWLETMRTENDLVAAETFPFTRFGKNERDLVTVDYLDIYTFRPKVQTAAAAKGVWK